MPAPRRPTKTSAAPRNPVPLRRKRIEQARRDVEGGRKDTERRGVPNDVPVKR
jgi:hypothetical protein